MNVVGLGLLGGVGVLVALPRCDLRDLLQRPRHAAQRSAEVRQVDERQQKTRHPEDVLMREERDQAQHGHDLELQLLALVGDPLGQRVQPQEDRAYGQHGHEKHQRHDDHQDVRIALARDEERQRVRRGGVKVGRHASGSCAPEIWDRPATPAGSVLALASTGCNHRLCVSLAGLWIARPRRVSRGT